MKLAALIFLPLAAWGQVFPGDMSDMIPLLSRPPLPRVNVPAHRSAKYIRQQFAMGQNVGIFREDDGTTPAYWPCAEMRDGLYSCIQMRRYGIAGTPHMMNKWDVRAPMVQVDQNAAGLVRAGTWTVNGANAATYGGTYDISAIAGSTSTWVSPAGSRIIGARIFGTSNAGFARVRVNGDPTAATLLMTAQQFVDAGTLAASALVANGGTLQPTDRMIDCFNGFASDRYLAFAELSPGVHEVIIEATGYKRAASSDARVYVTALLYQTAATTISTANVVMPFIYELTYQAGSNFDYAVQLIPTGAAQVVFQGGTHIYEQETSLTFAVNGSAVTPANFQVFGGSSASVRRVSYLTHPDVDSGTTAIADVDFTLSVEPSVGHRMRWTMEALTDGEARAFYPAMMPVSSKFTAGTTIGASTDADLTESSQTCKVPSKTGIAYMWEGSGNHGVMLEVPNVTAYVDNWSRVSTLGMCIEDRTGGLLEKAYLYRNQNPNWETYQIGRAHV